MDYCQNCFVKLFLKKKFINTLSITMEYFQIGRSILNEMNSKKKRNMRRKIQICRELLISSNTLSLIELITDLKSKFVCLNMNS